MGRVRTGDTNFQGTQAFMGDQVDDSRRPQIEPDTALDHGAALTPPMSLLQCVYARAYPRTARHARAGPGIRDVLVHVVLVGYQTRVLYVFQHFGLRCTPLLCICSSTARQARSLPRPNSGQSRGANSATLRALTAPRRVSVLERLQRPHSRCAQVTLCLTSPLPPGRPCSVDPATLGTALAVLQHTPSALEPVPTYEALQWPECRRSGVRPQRSQLHAPDRLGCRFWRVSPHVLQSFSPCGGVARDRAATASLPPVRFAL